MGLGDDELANPGQVSDIMRCGICLQVFKDPVFYGGSPCQHVFCRDCIETALKQCRRCPTCREIVPWKRVLQQHLAFRNLLDELLVRCMQAGCGWTGRLDARPAHMATCIAKQLEEARTALAKRDCAAKQLEETKAELSCRSVLLAQREFQLRSLQGKQQDLTAEVQRQQRLAADREDMFAHLRSRAVRLELHLAQRDARIAELQEELRMARCNDVMTAKLKAEFAAEAARQMQATLAVFEARYAEAARQAAGPARMDVDVEAERTFQIFVRELSGRTLVLKIGSRDMIWDVKRAVEVKTCIPASSFYLQCSGKNLADDRGVSDYNISKDSSLSMLVRLPSVLRGAPTDSARKRRRMLGA